MRFLRTNIPGSGMERHLPVVILALAFTVLASGAPASDPVWNAFAGRENLQLRGITGITKGEDVWFIVTKEQRTISSGTVKAEADAILTVPVSIPAMKPGVSLALDLTLRNGSDRGRILRNGTLWAFAERPFEPQRNPAAPRTILLFDPEGKTEPALRAIEMQFELLTRLDKLTGRTNAVIIVGEGVSLGSERGLWQALSAAVAQGNHVLLLAPKDGQLRPPSTWGHLVSGNAQDVLRRGTVSRLPYKMDLDAWPPDGKSVLKRFQMTGVRDEAVFNVTSETGNDAIGWDDAISGGRFRACGLAIIGKWNETPAARWLLTEMLEDH